MPLLQVINRRGYLASYASKRAWQNAPMARAFLMINTGSQRVVSKHGLLTTIAWQIGAEIRYALEGSVFTGGAVIQWLRDGLQLFPQASDSEELAGSVKDNGGVYFVAALTDLGAPHWDPHARGSIFGITRAQPGRTLPGQRWRVSVFKLMNYYRLLQLKRVNRLPNSKLMAVRLSIICWLNFRPIYPLLK